MSDIKSFQKYETHSFPVQASITSSFPKYWTYGCSAKKFLRHDLLFGMSAEVGSTGGRIYYADYSGSTGQDQLLKYGAIGFALGGWGKIKAQKLYYSVDLHPAVTFTTLRIRNFSSINRGRDYEAITAFRSVNVAAQPTFALLMRFDRFGINLFCGHQITIVSGKLKPKENNDAYLVLDGKPVKADWSGMRIGVGAVLFLRGRSTVENQ